MGLGSDSGDDSGCESLKILVCLAKIVGSHSKCGVGRAETMHGNQEEAVQILEIRAQYEGGF